LLWHPRSGRLFCYTDSSLRSTVVFDFVAEKRGPLLQSTLMAYGLC